jgi:hypothetical protein
MNYDRQWQVSSMTRDVSFQPRDFSNHSNFDPCVGDLGGHAEEMSIPKDELGAQEIKVGEWDKIGYSPSSSYQFYFALAIGSIVAGVAAGWSLGLNTHQLAGSNPATIEQQQMIAEMPTPHAATISPSHSPDSVPIAASREPEQSTLPAPIREPRLSSKTLPSKARHDRASSETSTLAAPQRGKALAEPVPETKPRTIEGWMIREVAGNTVVLEGPGGVWRATRGETVPGVGKVDSIVRWGNRWIVSTSRGLISTE